MLSRFGPEVIRCELCGAQGVEIRTRPSSETLVRCCRCGAVHSASGAFLERLHQCCNLGMIAAEGGPPAVMFGRGRPRRGETRLQQVPQRVLEIHKITMDPGKRASTGSLPDRHVEEIQALCREILTGTSVAPISRLRVTRAGERGPIYYGRETGGVVRDPRHAGERDRLRRTNRLDWLAREIAARIRDAVARSARRNV
jgi:hypothetical protein